jgi:hypothetical protein
MNPIKQIGRYLLPLLSIVVVAKRNTSGWRFWRKGGYDVLLTNGRTIHFNDEEKAAYDEAIDLHEKTLQVYGMARGAGLRG